MSQPTFVTIDGPKGSGKTTLLHCLRDALPNELKVDAQVERDLDPYRHLTEELIEQHKGKITADVEAEIARLLAAGRAEITKRVLANTDADVLLLDRWYPSDAYFRRCIPFENVLNLNLSLGVAEPDLILATVCDPEESWRRATSRPRGLASRAGLTKQQHVAASRAFERAIYEYGFMRLQTDGPIEDAIGRAREAILHVIRTRKSAD